MMPSSKKELSLTLAFTSLVAITIASVATLSLSSWKKGGTEEADRQEDNNNVVFSTITTRRTISAFEPMLPSGWQDLLKKAIKAAISAPNHKRTEPWRFYVPNSDTIRKICELNASIVAEGKGGAKAGEAKLKKWLKVPGWLIVTCTTESETGTNTVTMEDPKGRQREDYAAVCCAVQNLLLALHSDGLGTKWTTGKVNFDDRFRQIASIPRNEYVVGTIWFGKPSKSPSPRQTKFSIENVLKIEHEK